MRLVWTTDPHLNHVPADQREGWFDRIASHGADGVVISGDISEGDDVVLHLNRIAASLAMPVFFVLGNHDFYRSSFGTTRQQVINASGEDARLFYLTNIAAIEIDDGLFLTGDDGWGDATEGDYEHSTIHLNDFRLIEDFHTADPSRWKQQLFDLGRDSAERLGEKLKALPQSARHVLIVTHVPPFREACWYEGKTTDDNWAPFFVCGQLGQTIRRFADARPSCRFTVLCGHTHNEGIAQITDNLVVHTGTAVYGQPDLEGLVTIDDDGIRIEPV